jgi:septal ring factor EnvC (AmiA/AmiB activator)
MSGRAQQQRPSNPTRMFGWLAAVVAPVAMLGGFANAAASQPVEAVTEQVTEYRTVEPQIFDEVAEVTSERARLNRVKQSLNAVKDRLERRRAALIAREAALDRRERALSVIESTRR